MTKPYPPVQYHDYLGLDQLLSSQKEKSVEYGQPAHDEMLFIIVHQAYELWFKQINHDLDSMSKVFSQSEVDEKNMGTVVSRLQRITKIQKVLLEHLDVLETMTPLDFLEFRDFLVPASGFQSYQFRLIENKMGLRKSERLNLSAKPYTALVRSDQQKELEAFDEKNSLFELVQNWLERTPFFDLEGYDFWSDYQTAVKTLFESDRKVIERNEFLSDEDKEKNYQNIDNTLKTFAALFDQDRYEELREEGQWRFSYKAMHAALFIHLYRDQPMLHLPYKMLATLLDIDELFTSWRYRHALMAHRMLGAKIGTGGSAGHEYLKMAAEKHKIYTDLFNLSTYFIPRSSLPPLPRELEDQLSFNFTVNHR